MAKTTLLSTDLVSTLSYVASGPSCRSRNQIHLSLAADSRHRVEKKIAQICVSTFAYLHQKLHCA